MMKEIYWKYDDKNKGKGLLQSHNGDICPGLIKSRQAFREYFIESREEVEPDESD